MVDYFEDNKADIFQIFSSVGCKPFLYNKPLYKFVTVEGARNILEHNQLKYTNPAHFKDSLELSLDCFQVSHEKSTINKFLLKHNPKEIVESLNDIQIDLISEHFEQFFYNHLNNFRSQTGVLCMTEISNDDKIWKVYADNFNGLCLEFDFTSYNYIENPNFIFMHVKYVDKLDKYDFIEQPQKALLNWVISKNATLFSYEREIRSIEMANPKFKHFEKSCLKSITFGRNCSPLDKTEIIALSTKLNYSVDFIDQKIC